jgi:lipopolysaccharide export system protein LptA
MASCRPNAARVTLALLVASGGVVAQIDDMRMPVDIDAENLEYIGESSMVKFTGLKLTQGGISITADVAHTTSTDFNDSTWDFAGNVVFDVNEGHIECKTANMRFTEFQLQVATIEGSPATFRFQRPGAEDSTYAAAQRLHYDVAKGVIEFSGDAEFSEGGNRIASETLVYEIRERRVKAVSSDDPEDRVKVTYTPPPDVNEKPDPSSDNTDERQPREANEAPREDATE